MLKKAALVLFGCAGVAFAGNDWMENAVIKLIERYYELSQKVQELSQRLERLERELEKRGKEEIREYGVKEKYQTQERLKVRACPRASCKVVVVLERGEVVSLLSRKGTWAFIETTDGVRGWVVSKHLREYYY